MRKEQPSLGFRRQLGLSFGALLLVTALAELAVRLFIAEPGRYVEDPVRGRIPRPGSSRHQANEGVATARYDRYGLRDSDELATPSKGERRVLVVGDSLTEAVEVDESQTFVRRAQALLRADGLSVRVINSGRMAYLAGEMVHAAEVLGPALAADTVVLVVRPDSFGADRDPHVLLPGYWAWRYEASDDGGVRGVPLAGPGFALKRVPGVTWLKQRVALLDSGFGLWLSRAEAARPAAVAPAPDLSLIQRRVELALDRLKKAFAGRVALVLITRDNVLSMARSPETPLEAAVRAGARAQQVAFWSTREAFYDEVWRARRLPVGFENRSPPGEGHLNPVGHELVARQVAALVKDLVR